jgi:hypothetical protein
MKKQVLILLMALTNIFSTATAQTAITQGLVAYYPFNGNANDESGKLNHGTVHSATLTTDRFGIENRAYSFDGNGNYIEIPSSSTLTFSNTFSLCAFVSVNNFQHSAPIKQQAIISKIVDGDWYGGYELKAQGDGTNSLFVSTTNINGNNLYPYQTGFFENQWYFVCSVYDGINFKLYVNGSEKASLPASGQIQTSDIPLRIGRRGGAGFYNCYFNGKIDDVRIYNRALSNTEIQQLYTENSVSDSRVVMHNNAKSILITPDLIQTNSTVTGSSNTFFGENALKSNRDGSSNTALGYQAGTMTSGSGNIFLGANAGNHLDFQNTSNKLIISNSNTNTPLIYGEFDNGLLKVNGKLLLQKNTGVPASSNSTGIQGQLAFDNEYFYICVQNNIWKRFLLNTW